MLTAVRLYQLQIAPYPCAQERRTNPQAQRPRLETTPSRRSPLVVNPPHRCDSFRFPNATQTHWDPNDQTLADPNMHSSTGKRDRSVLSLCLSFVPSRLSVRLVLSVPLCVSVARWRPGTTAGSWDRGLSELCVPGGNFIIQTTTQEHTGKNGL